MRSLNNRQPAAAPQRQAGGTAEQSASVVNLLAALADAHTEIENIQKDREVEVPIKDKQNPGQYRGKYKYLYATLAGILHTVRPILTSRGIWYTQRVVRGEMVTRLFHKSGEWMDAGHVPMPDVKGNPQDIGSIISYFKRYSLTAALGLAAEEDGDGEMGDREVDFRARGAAPASANRTVKEPEMGWGDWTRGMITTIKAKTDPAELQQVYTSNEELLYALKEHDIDMYEDIRRNFRSRKAALIPSEGF